VGVEAQPRRKGNSVDGGCGVDERVAVRILEPIGRNDVRERLAFVGGQVLVAIAKVGIQGTVGVVTD